MIWGFNNFWWTIYCTLVNVFFVYCLLLLWIMFNHVFKEPIETVYYILLDSEPKHLSYRNGSIGEYEERIVNRKKNYSYILFIVFFFLLSVESSIEFISIFLNRCFFSTFFASVWSKCRYNMLIYFKQWTKTCSSFNELHVKFPFNSA